MKHSRAFAQFIHLTLVAAIAGGMTACSGGSGSTLPATALAKTAPASDGLPRAVVHKAATVAPGQMPFSADSLPGDHDATNNFIDSIGVNTKLDFAGSVYANYPGVKNALVRLGVRHIRDEFSTQNLNNYENNLADLAASGIHSELGLTIHEDAQNNAIVNVTGTQAAAYLQAGHYLASLEAIEGINEPDVNQSNPNGPSPIGWVAITQAQQQLLYTGIAGLTAPAKPIPVYGPSVGSQSDYAAVGNLSQYLDFGNIHDYSGGYDLPPATIVSAVSAEATISGSKPVLASENGYATGSTGQGMPDVIMLDYTQRLFFKQFANGVKRTLWYELADESATPNNYWLNSGLVNNALVPKPAYVGLANIISLLKDQTHYVARTPLNVSFGSQGQFENLTQLLLQKNDGSYWLVVWSDLGEWVPAANGSPGSYPVPAATPFANSMNFLGTYVKSITEYDEDNTGAMTSQPVAVSNGATAQISVGGRPKIYQIVPGVAPIVPAAPVIATPAAHWSLDDGSGNVALDSVDPAGNLTITTPAKSAWITGEYNAGLGLSGTQASVANLPIDTSQSYSATAWVQMNSLTGYQAFVAVNGQSQCAFALDFTPQSNLSYTSYSNDTSNPAVTRIGSTITPVIGHWYAVAATFNAGTRKMSLYINGVLQSTGTPALVFKATGTTEIGSMMQGGVGHYQWMAGGVDEVNLYSRELTPAEVATMAGL